MPTVKSTDQPETEASPDDVPRGCAWFDSSLDLQHGLKVRELELTDPRCGSAFLDGWLAWVTGADLTGGAGRRAAQA